MLSHVTIDKNFTLIRGISWHLPGYASIPSVLSQNEKPHFFFHMPSRSVVGRLTDISAYISKLGISIIRLERQALSSGKMTDGNHLWQAFIKSSHDAYDANQSRIMSSVSLQDRAKISFLCDLDIRIYVFRLWSVSAFNFFYNKPEIIQNLHFCYL